MSMRFIDGETISIILFFIGVYGLIARRNIIKSIICIGIMEVAAILLFISVNFKEGSEPPIGHTGNVPVADPLPQALMITAIVIGICVTAVSLTIFISMYHKYGSTNWDKVLRKKAEIEND